MENYTLFRILIRAIKLETVATFVVDGRRLALKPSAVNYPSDFTLDAVKRVVREEMGEEALPEETEGRDIALEWLRQGDSNTLFEIEGVSAGTPDDGADKRLLVFLDPHRVAAVQLSMEMS